MNEKPLTVPAAVPPTVPSQDTGQLLVPQRVGIFTKLLRVVLVKVAIPLTSGKEGVELEADS